MSIEQKIDDLIAALDRNTAARTGAASPSAAPAEVAAAPRRGRPPKAETAPVSPPVLPAAVAVPPPASAAPVAPAATPTPVAPAAASGVTIKQICDLVVAVGSKQRQTVIDLFAEFKVARASDLKAEQYDAFFAALTAKSAPAPAANPGSDLV